MKSPTTKRVGWCITVEGVVQGVGFRPTVWNLAHQYQLSGSVWNDAAGVTIEVWGGVTQLASFLQQLEQHPPPLAIITHLHTTTLPEEESTSIPTQFTIVESRGGTVTTAVAADAATCSDCLADILEPENRRYGYPFTNCTHCGPRLSIIEAIPYDRRNTSMSHFTLCPNCLQEYEDPASRRFHAQPNCCPKCGPALWLEQAEEKLLPGDPITISAQLIESGAIIAIKGLGGFHLACDATNEAAVSRLRQRKLRPTKALAVMAKDCAAISPYAVITEQAKHALESRSAPIVILEQREQGKTVAPSIAPGQQSIGFMLPYTPLHHLLMAQLETPIVLTSGNRSQEPQCISNQAAREQLSGIVDYWLLHDRKIINRVDDAVVREAGGEIRTLRYGRGMAPQTLSLPPGFNSSPPLLAMGGMLKNSFALLRESGITLSQYIGDLENPASIHEYQKSLQRYNHLFEHHPEAIVVDRHPDYLSTQLGRRWSAEQRLPLFEVQHHHAHIASCMVEHHLALNHPPLLGIALDGLGYGDQGEIWGGEFLFMSYRHYQRVASFTPIAMPGGNRASREPWRNCVAHLAAVIGWERLSQPTTDLELFTYLQSRPLHTIEQMVHRGVNSPLASSCGRLIDAVACSVGLCRDATSFEGEAAIALEAIATPQFVAERGRGYPYQPIEADRSNTIGWQPLWSALLDDLRHSTPPATIAARFHHGLITAVSETTIQLSNHHPFSTVVLSGGVFQNRLLLEGVSRQLENSGFTVLSPQRFPANDQGIALGQCAVAAAQMSEKRP